MRADENTMLNLYRRHGNALERKRRMKLAARLRGADASKSYDHRFAASVSGRKQADGGREHEGS